MSSEGDGVRSMATSDLDFSIDWLGDASSTDPEVVTFGALELRADGVVLTDVEDLLARTTRSSVRVSLELLARWFVDNWWRLRWEPFATRMTRERLARWKMAHDVSAAGGGFVWPKMRIVGDGNVVTITSEPTTSRHTIRYLSSHEVHCTGASFERTIDRLVTTVLARQQSAGAAESDLPETWEALRAERSDAGDTAFRKREALMGLDPGEVDPEALDAVFRKGEWLGSDALDEALVGASPGAASKLLDVLADMNNRSLKTLSLDRVLSAASDWSPPGPAEAWKTGDSLAHHLRSAWGLRVEDPVSDELLNDLLGFDIGSDELALSENPPFVAFRDDHHVRPALKRTNLPKVRRFAIARLLADAVIAPASDALLQLTPAKTARQRIQRAAAQELLCPIEGLKRRVNLPDPDDDELTEAAEYYQVSEQVVRNALVNKRLMPRSSEVGFDA